MFLKSFFASKLKEPVVTNYTRFNKRVKNSLSNLLALSFIYNSREDGGKKGSSNFDEKPSLWKDTTVTFFQQIFWPNSESPQKTVTHFIEN